MTLRQLSAQHERLSLQYTEHSKRTEGQPFGLSDAYKRCAKAHREVSNCLMELAESTNEPIENEGAKSDDKSTFSNLVGSFGRRGTGRPPA